MAFVSVFSGDTYCFSCFGFDKDDPNKCENSENLYIRKCTTNSSKLPRCIKYTADYIVPQMYGNRLVEETLKVHGVHCGTSRQCSRNDCPNFWPKDVKAKNCEVQCCDPAKPSSSCNFPMPDDDLIREYNKKKAEEGKKSGQAVAGQRSSDATTIGWTVWLQAVSFAIFGWCKLGIL